MEGAMPVIAGFGVQILTRDGEVKREFQVPTGFTDAANTVWDYSDSRISVGLIEGQPGEEYIIRISCPTAQNLMVSPNTVLAALFEIDGKIPIKDSDDNETLLPFRCTEQPNDLPGPLKARELLGNFRFADVRSAAAEHNLGTGEIRVVIFSNQLDEPDASTSLCAPSEATAAPHAELDTSSWNLAQVHFDEEMPEYKVGDHVATFIIRYASSQWLQEYGFKP
jgi:hypothetical protein